MSLSHSSPRHRVAVADARERAIDQRLRRLAPHVQSRVRSLIARDPWLADLVVSFPALTVALAWPRRGFNSEPVIARVIEGAGLAELARLVDVPMWLRKLPGAAFTGPIPALPDSEMFRRQIANHIPTDAKLLADWLAAIATMYDVGGEHVALWAAREMKRAPKALHPTRRRLIALWAWYSGAEGTWGRRLIHTPFAPVMQSGAAWAAANAWSEELELHLTLTEVTVTDTWLEPDTVDGFTFVPLTTPEQMTQESQSMENCVRTYGWSVASNSARLWRVERDGARVATLSLANHPSGLMPHINQILGLRNEAVASEVWHAAYRWLVGQLSAGSAERFRRTNLDVRIVEDRWREMWRPYWLEKQRIPPWLPLASSRHALVNL
jgi:hypothetical protein